MKISFKYFLLVFFFVIKFSFIHAQNINHQNIPCPMGMFVNSFNGNLFLPRTDLYIEGRKLPFNLTFYYNSNNSNSNLGYGNGWSMEYLMKYIGIENGGIRFTRGDGYSMDFEPVSANSFKPKPGSFDSVVKYQQYKFKMITKERTTFFFEDSIHKRLTKIQEVNGNTLEFTYSDSLITQIKDGSNRVVQLSYISGRLNEITDANDSPIRKIKYKYTGENLTEVEDPLGKKIGYSYLVNGPLSRLTDKNGNSADIIYSSGNFVQEIITCFTNQRFSYNKQGGITMMVELVSGKNQTTTYKYNSKGQIVNKEGNCCGFNTSFEYDNDGNVVKFTDANGHASVFTYDNKGNMLSKKDPLGFILRMTYNEFSGVSSFTDKNGNTTSFLFDNRGNITKATYPENITNEFTYASNGDMLTSKDGNVNITSYTYDSYGNVTGVHKPLGSSYSGTYDNRSRITSVTDPNDNTTTFTHDFLDRMTAVTDATSHAIIIEYDANDNVTKYIDRNTNTTLLNYDAADRLIKVTNALGHFVSGTYDERDNLTSYTDEKGNKTLLSYDNLNRLSQVTNAANEVTQYGYAPNGKLINMIYPNGNGITITRDDRDKITEISDSIGLVSQRQYDAKGNLISLTNGMGNNISFEYDALNRLIKRTDPLGFTEEYTYDKNYNILSFKDKNGHIKSVAYDALNRAIIYTDALNFPTTYGYDPAGNLLHITDANDNPTDYTYDNLNRQISTTYADGKGSTATYDANGNVLTFTDGKGITTNYVYDDIDQLTKMDFPDSNDYNYSYDAAGNIISAENEDAVVTFTYDFVNRIASESLNGNTTGYSYNIPGRLFTTTYPTTGRIITKSFDARNRLTGIKEGSQNLFTASYDFANRMTTQTFGNGGSVSYNYDAGDRLLSKFMNSIPPVGFEYTYDNAGNKKTEKKTHKPDHSEQYIYDNEDQLVEFNYGTLNGNVISSPTHFQKFNYDGLGNRITSIDDNETLSYTTNNLNQYFEITGNTTTNQTFDDNGNMTVSGTDNYSYNTLDQLTSVNSIAMKYDAFNRLISVSTLSDTTKYNYSFLNSIEIKKSGNNISNVFGNGLDNLISINSGGQNHFALQNNVNSVTSLTDNSNHITEYYENEPFGSYSIFNNTYLGISSSLIGNELQFGGRNKIEETGIYNFRFRYLSFQHGRFIQRDPLEYVDGMNDLSFVNNNSVNNIDPLGLKERGKKKGVKFNYGYKFTGEPFSVDNNGNVTAKRKLPNYPKIPLYVGFGTDDNGDFYEEIGIGVETIENDLVNLVGKMGTGFTFSLDRENHTFGNAYFKVEISLEVGPKNFRGTTGFCFSTESRGIKFRVQDAIDAYYKKIDDVFDPNYGN